MPTDPRASEFGKTNYSRRSAVLAPLRIKQKVIGCLSAFDKQDSAAFSVDDQRLLTTFAEQAAMAIRNARLYEAVQRNVARLETLQAITRRITAALALEDLLADLARAAAEAIEAGHTWIGLLETGASVVRPVASHGVDQEYLAAIRVSVDENDPAGRGPGGVAMRTGSAHIVRDCVNDPSFAPALPVENRPSRDTEHPAGVFLAQASLKTAALNMLSERPWRGSWFLWPQARKRNRRPWQKGNASMRLRSLRRVPAEQASRLPKRLLLVMIVKHGGAQTRVGSRPPIARVLMNATIELGSNMVLSFANCCTGVNSPHGRLANRVLST